MRRTSTVSFLLRALIVIAGICILAYGAAVFANDVRMSRPATGFTVFLADKDICSMAIGIDERGDDVIWAGGSNGLFRIYKGRSEEIGDYRYVKALLVEGNEIWIGHDQGITILDGDDKKTFTIKEGLPDNRVNALCADTKGNVWAGTWGGVAVFESGALKRIMTMKDGLIDDMVNVIMQDDSGGMWFGSYVAPRGGLCIYFNDEWQYFTVDDDLVHSNINAVIQLDNRDVIAGGGLYTKGGGTVFAFDGRKWSAKSKIAKSDGLAGAKIRSLMEDGKKRLWVGSEYEGLAVLENGNSKILTEKNGLPNNEVKCMKEDRKGTIWIGTRMGLVRIEKGGLENVR
ncbi:MAG: ligand-binding sensor domain-containing protein [Saccharofermentanales bacterium]